MAYLVVIGIIAEIVCAVCSLMARRGKPQPERER